MEVMKTPELWIEFHERETRSYLCCNSSLRENHAFHEKAMAVEKPWQSGGVLGADYFIAERSAWKQ